MHCNFVRILQDNKNTATPTYTGIMVHVKRDKEERMQFFFCNNNIEWYMKGTYTLDSNRDAFIHAPSFSFKEVKWILESDISANRIPTSRIMVCVDQTLRPTTALTHHNVTS
jgi:hypothetical protein